MSKDKTIDPNSQGYTNALLEDLNDKFQAVLEATAPIPKMQEKLDKVLSWGENVTMIPSIVKAVGKSREDINRILKWEEKVDLIPAIFEEVGSLRREVEILKEALILLGRHDDRMEEIDERLAVVEERVK